MQSLGSEYKVKILVGVVDYNPGVKDYALPKLYENLEICVKQSADILFVSDRQHSFDTHIVQQPRSYHSEDILYLAREYIRDYAYKNKYDAFIWQGIDCFYRNKYDFLRFIRRAERWDILAVGALTSARTNSSIPVARRFTGVGTEQQDIPDDELDSGSIVPCYGFTGADALLVKPPLMQESWMQFKNFRPWYELRDENPHSLCVEEFWIYKLGQKYHNAFWIDTAIRTWHVHEDGIARRWPGEERNINDLSFV